MANRDVLVQKIRQVKADLKTGWSVNWRIVVPKLGS